MSTALTADFLNDSAKRIAQYLEPTPVMRSSALDNLVGAELYFKCENFQKTGSFKARGALNAVLLLSEEDAQRGVCTHSSGNHGQALAWAASLRPIPAYVVVPKNAPKVKVAAMRQYGAEVIFCEANLEARESTLAEVQGKYGASFIPPFNHEWIIAGQSSCAREFVEQAPEMEAIICPVGGGGLLAGSALIAGEKEITLYGAEPRGADDAYRSFRTGERVLHHQPDTIADGLRTTLGALNFPIIRESVQDILLADETEIVRAMRLIWERMKIVVEPSCAVPLAALIQNRESVPQKKIGLILSGGNVDLEALPFGNM